MEENVKKIVLTEERLPIDCSRQAKKGCTEVLLYDKVKKCYYRTDVESIICLVLKKLAEKERELDAKYSELAKRLTDEQSRFISDMVSTNEAIMALVQKDGGNSK